VPELPDVVVYVEALERRIVGQPLLRVRLANPFLLRTALPPIAAVEGKRVRGVQRLGKRVVLELEDELFLVLHLMIAGRLRWLERGEKAPTRITLALFDFPAGTLAFTEAGTKRRASLHLVQGKAALGAFDMGGLDVLDIDARTFRDRLLKENHTLKRALTDPRLFSGIGNAYSDEILHRARLSPIAMTQKLDAAQIDRVYEAVRTVLAEWTARHGGAWALPRALSRVRGAGAAHRLRRKRDQLLRALPDRRGDPRRSGVVAPAQVELAAVDRRVGVRIGMI